MSHRCLSALPFYIVLTRMVFLAHSGNALKRMGNATHKPTKMGSLQRQQNSFNSHETHTTCTCLTMNRCGHLFTTRSTADADKPARRVYSGYGFLL